MKIIFIHGGPGLNSNPESNLWKTQLKTLEAEFFFWNEPSELRGNSRDPSRAYDSWKFSLFSFITQVAGENRVTLMAHSFAAFAINDLLVSLKDKVQRLILISPVTNLLRLDGNIIEIAIKKLENERDTSGALELLRLKRTITTDFTEERYKILLKALAHPEVLPAYWFNKDVSQGYNQFFQGAHQFDLESFKNVRGTIITNESLNIFSGPVEVHSGIHDPVTSIEQDFSLLSRLYPQAKVYLYQNSGHYPHIEEQELFFKRTGLTPLKKEVFLAGEF